MAKSVKNVVKIFYRKSWGKKFLPYEVKNFSWGKNFLPRGKKNEIVKYLPEVRFYSSANGTGRRPV